MTKTQSEGDVDTVALGVAALLGSCVRTKSHFRSTQPNDD